MTVQRVLVLGGYGNFGKRIAESLSSLANITVIIAGRSVQKAHALQQTLSTNKLKANLEVADIDINSAHFTERLQSLSPDLVIHTGGPFQGQSYKVPLACISIGSHYIDLADDRRFVCDIVSLNKLARQNNVLIVSGASSVPGLSSTVIDHFISQFSTLNTIDFAIAPGNKAERGEATIRGILSYTGHSFKTLNKGKWIDQYGWMAPRKLNFGNTIGKRWLANIDIPDLELFPERYKSVNTVLFQAGLELPFLHFGMVLMAYLAKKGLIKNWSTHTKAIYHASELFKNFGTDNGGMRIDLSGLDKEQKHKQIIWTLTALDGIGPYIPTISAIILAKKMISGRLNIKGAMPCLGLYTLAEFDQEANPLGIYHQTEYING